MNKNELGFYPIGKRIVAQKYEKQNNEFTTKGGIILTSEPTPEGIEYAKVIIVSDDMKADYSIGEYVVYTRFKIEKFKWQGQEYVLLNDTDIVAKVEQDKI